MLKSPLHTEENIRAAQAAQKQKKKKHSQLLEVWTRFRRNPIAMVGLVIIVLMVILAAIADLVAPGTDIHPGYAIQHRGHAFLPPSFSINSDLQYNPWTGEYEEMGTGERHIFGTDHLGRDVFARIAHGSRITLMVGFVVVSVSMTLGVALGSIAGFYGKFADNIIMRVIDVVLAMPTILLAIVIAAALDLGVWGVMVAVGIGAIPGFARITRAQVLTIREQEFIEAAHSAGASDFRLIFRHVIPNCTAPIIVEATMGMAGAIAAAAALSFLGLGVQSPTPEWGAMLSEGRQFIVRGEWHLILFPGIAIALIIFALNMMGDGLRDAFDPRLRGASFSKRRFKRIVKAKQKADSTQTKEGTV
ncbi:MAG: ABC transporter permease [Defluviitaleaceae bacterium]|nr:ABC transporter permease [Defluviitaleaceae bacterium]